RRNARGIEGAPHRAGGDCRPGGPEGDRRRRDVRGGSPFAPQRPTRHAATARSAPAADAAAVRTPRLAKPYAATSQPPSEAAPSQPTLDIVTLRPRTAPRAAEGTSESVAMTAGRPAAFASE